MDAQMVDNTSPLGSENSDQGNGKKSVLKKVKDKAKKIKKSLIPGKHRDNGDDGEDDGEDDEQELLENKAYHPPASPPTPPHASVDPTVPENKPRDDLTDRSLGDHLRGSNVESDSQEPNIGEVDRPDSSNYQSKVADPIYDEPSVIENKPRSDNISDRSLGDVLSGSKGEADFQEPSGAFEQPDPSHYQSKVADPIDDEPSEIDSGVIENKPREHLTDAILGSNLEEDPYAPSGEFDKPISGNYQSKVADPTDDNHAEAQVGSLADELGALKVEETGPTGSHDQFLPDADTPYTDDENETRPASYTEKISAATSAVTGSAVSAKDAIANKLGYGNKEVDQSVPETVDTIESRDYVLPASDDANEVDAPDNRPPASYTEKLSAATSAVTGSAVSAKDAIADKLGYGRKEGDQSVPTEGKQTAESHDQFLPASDYIPENDVVNEVDPVPENAPPTSYTEKLSAATSAVTGSAVSAKDAIAGKLGYGNKEGEQQQPASETAPVGTRIRETLAPVYGKVAGVGTAVASKLPGTGTGDGSDVNSPLSERLRPGDEDRALSEVISGALSRKKDSTDVEPAGETAGERSLAGGGGGSPGSGNVVDRIKVAVTSLFSKGSENTGQVASPEEAPHVEGRLHETTN